MQFDFSSFILGKTSDVVFLWKYISIIYVYLFFASLSKYSKPNWSGKRTLAQRFSFLFVLPCGSGVFLLQLGLG